MMLSETPKSNNTLNHIKEFLGFSHSSSKTLQSSSSFMSSRSPRPSSYDVSESMMEENIINAAPIITKWDIDSSEYYKITYIFHHDRNEAEEFLKSVKNLRQAMHYLVAENSTSDKLVLAQKLMQVAMKRLEKEFYQILTQNRDHLDPESVSSRSSNSRNDGDGEAQLENEMEISSDSMTEEDRVLAVAMTDLKSIADCMIGSGYGRECVKIYKVIRKSIIDETLYRLGTERFKSSRIQRMNWETLEHVIKNWMNGIKVAVNSLFRGERILCDHVFSRSDNIRESCFSEITKEGASTLFKFPELIAKGISKKDSEKIFLLMELYEVNSDIWPDIESLFNFGSTSLIKLQAQTSMLKLGDSIRSILSDFETTIQKDSSKTPAPGGGIHPLTKSAMNYICSLADYAGILSEIVPSSPHVPNSDIETMAMDGTMTSAVSTQLAWLILVLLCKLDSKAELYKDVSLSYLFLANNLHFIMKRVCSTNLKNLLGDEWISNYMNKVKLYASNYESMAWYKVFSSLPENNLQETSPQTAKESFKKFNEAFEAAYRKQTSWTVDDRKLRDELKVSIANKLLPRYQEFYNENFEMLIGENNLKMFVRFSPDDLGNYLSDLFHGISTSGGSVSSSSSSSSHSSQGCVPILSH